MRQLSYSLCLLFFVCLNLQATVVYKSGINLITGTWQGEGVISEISSDNPYEGGQHYRVVYNFADHWSGFGLNMDNWGTTGPVDFSGFTHLRIAYRGVSAQHTFRIQLRSNDVFGVLYDVGGPAQDYMVVDIPLVVLTSGTAIDLSDITEIDINVVSNNATGSGNLFFDAIELVNIASPEPSIAWPMAAAMSAGFNLNNWLEAYWLIPFNAYPEVNKYRREHIAFLASGGMKTMRMPVTFERLADTEPPYAFDLNHIAFSLVDSCILWAQDYGLILSIDNHHGYELTDENYLEETPRLCAIWKQIVQRYGNLPIESTLFELLNEPTYTISKNNLYYVQRSIIDTIRQYVPDHTIVVGANSYNSGAALAASQPYDDNNIVYTFHSYDPYNFTHQGMSWTSPPFFPAMNFPQGNDMANLAALFATVHAWSDLHNVPVWMGEFGVANSADLQSRCNYMEAVMGQIDQYSMPYAYWDVFSVSDGFGFADPNDLIPSAVIPCFEDALHLNFSPLSIIKFDSKVDCDKDRIVLSWMLSELDSKVEIQSSVNGYDWNPVEILEGRDHTYTYTLSTISGLRYFRLKVLSIEGYEYYSPVQVVECEQNKLFKVFPNPAHEMIKIKLSHGTNHIGFLTEIVIINSMGQVLRKLDMPNKDDITIPLFGFPSGLYFIRTMDHRGEYSHSSFVVE